LQAGCAGEGPDVPGHLSLLRPPVLRARGAPPSIHEEQVARFSFVFLQQKENVYTMD
jgi:hypothetical protein